MRTVIAAVLLIVLASACGSSSSSDPVTVSTRGLSAFWLKQGDFWAEGYVKSACADLRDGVDPQSEALSIAQAVKGATVKDGISLVSASIRSTCPHAATIPPAWH